MKKILTKRRKQLQNTMRLYACDCSRCSGYCQGCGSVPSWDYMNVYERRLVYDSEGSYAVSHNNFFRP